MGLVRLVLPLSITKGKVTPVGSRTPAWSVPEYVNETTPEELKELERIKKELSNKNK